MARPAPPTDTIRVAIDGTIYNHAYTNVFWCLVNTDGTRTVADLNSLLDLFNTQYNSQFLANTGNDVSQGTANGVWQTSAATVLASTRTVSHTGLAGTPVEDAGSCFVISWKIAARYRGGKPRTYLPGPTQGTIANGSDVSAGQQTALATAAEAFRTAINGFTATHISSCQLGTVSFFSAGGSTHVPPVYRTPPVFEPYIAASARAKLGSQRRRILS